MQTIRNIQCDEFNERRGRNKNATQVQKLLSKHTKYFLDTAVVYCQWYLCPYDFGREVIRSHAEANGSFLEILGVYDNALQVCMFR